MTVEELDEQSLEEQEEAQSKVLGNPDEVPIVEGGGLDVDFTKYEGLRFKIASVRQIEVIDYFTGPLGSDKKPTYNKESKEIKRQIEIETESIPKLDKEGQITNELLKMTKNGKESNVTVRAALNLTRKFDENGKEIWVISKAPSAKLYKFMRKLGCDKPMKMKGKLVTLTTVPDRDEASDRRWLRIVI